MFVVVTVREVHGYIKTDVDREVTVTGKRFRDMSAHSAAETAKLKAASESRAFL